MREYSIPHGNDAGRTFNVFYYGLFMDADTPCATAVTPRDPRLAFIDDHVVRLGVKAMLLLSPGQRACGALYRLKHREMDTSVCQR